jgi:lycopene beta-cyclase
MRRHRHVRPRGATIIGSGLSGSLLAQELAARGVGPVEIIDRSTMPARGRTWAAFVRGAGHPASRSFSRVVVRAAGAEHQLELHEHVYEVVDSRALSEHTDDALAAVHGRRTRRDVPAGEVGGGAGWVFDSRRRHSRPEAWMHFHGWRIEAADGCFDAGSVTLMDLTVAQHGSLRFGYVLPTSSRAALVELTAVHRSDELPDLEGDLAEYVAHLAPCGWRIVGQEQGRLPLEPHRRRRRRGRVLPIGTAAGMVRSSTGYGLPAMRRDAQRIADEVASGRRPRGWNRPTRHVLMDSVFLEMVLIHPEIARLALEQLFARNPVDRVVRFLDDDSTLADDARLIASLPVRPFLSAAVRRAVRPVLAR